MPLRRQSHTAVQARRADFWIYWTGQTVSHLGSSFTTFALPLLVYQLTGSALNLGIATAATFVPYLLFGLVIGAWVDRVNRKRLMILTDVLRSLAAAAIPVLAALGVLAVWQVYVLAFISSTLTIFFTSAEFAVIPSLVSSDDLVSANGRIQASYSGASVLGPLLAGLLLTLLPLSAVFLVDASSFVVSAISILLIRVSFNLGAAGARRHILREVGEGLRFVLRHPILRNISFMMALVNLVSNVATAQLVLFASRQLHASNSQIAQLYAAGSIGVVVFSVLAGPLRRRFSFGVVALGALMIEGLLLEAFAYQTNFVIAAALWGCGGMWTLLNINTGSLRQSITPNHLLGRVMSISTVVAWSAIPIGAIAGGFAVQETGDVSFIFALVGAVTFVIPLAFFVFSPLGRVERYLAQHPSIRAEQAEGALDVPLAEPVAVGALAPAAIMIESEVADGVVS
ncbi:MAG TPA: MFS transporter [Ktedonobacterales bacterium]